MSTTALADILAPGATLERLATGATWGEGPAWIPATRTLRFSDIPGNRILQWSADTGELTVYQTDVEFANGRTLAADGSVIQCSHGRRAIERERDGHLETLIDRFGDHRLNSPNDVIVHSDGSIWFTDPPYGITQAHEGHLGTPEYGGNYVFRLVPDGTLSAVITDMEEPNGLAFSPDERILYVTDTSAALRTDGTGHHHIMKFDVVAHPGGPPTLESGHVFAEISPGLADGIRVDEDGRVFSSSASGVQVFSPEGELLGVIEVPETVGNLTFGGPEGTDLFIVATTSLYRIPTRVRDASSRWRS
ncbi:SMP-30/gluconolactonase/LRE family protein [Haematomicrobium sanguinis]|uniref:SMP-30/gluconolactonase/LRE family protein n=1 Tax=Haematomicrobium sanguinis TaxID=479106 RepID=UPI00047D22F7|nr:SMP-30/gluconolactonase/LRE family protein [Haematomicrobium sanguinis]